MGRNRYSGSFYDLVKAPAIKNLMPDTTGYREALEWMTEHEDESVPPGNADTVTRFVNAGYDTRKEINRAKLRASARGLRTWGDVLDQPEEMTPF